MKSKIAAISLVIIAVFLSTYLVYSSDYFAESHFASLARVEGLEREKYLSDDSEQLVTRYIAMGYYANSIIDTSNDAIYRIFSALLPGLNRNWKLPKLSQDVNQFTFFISALAPRSV